jgi:hypothetical protein
MNRAKDVLQRTGKFSSALLTRIEKLYIFKRLPREVVVEIVELEAQRLARSYGLTLVWIDPQLIAEAVIEVEKSSEGLTRGMDQAMMGLFGKALRAAQKQNCQKIRLTVGPDEQIEVEAVD